MEKPQSEIYKIACKRLGVKTDEVIYMEDSCVTTVIYGEPNKLIMKVAWRV